VHDIDGSSLSLGIPPEMSQMENGDGGGVNGGTLGASRFPLSFQQEPPSYRSDRKLTSFRKVLVADSGTKD